MAQSPDQQFSDTLKQAATKREEELQRINALKERLLAIRKEPNSEATKQELTELRLKCENLLNEAQKIADETEASILQSKQEIESVLGAGDSNDSETEKLKKKISDLTQENARVKDQYFKVATKNTTLKTQVNTQKDTIRKVKEESTRRSLAQAQTTSPTESIDWKQKALESQSHAAELQRQLKELTEKYASEERSEPLSAAITTQPDTKTNTNASTSTNTSSNTVEDPRQQANNQLIEKQLKYLQATFESEEALARALYHAVGAEFIPSPDRSGYLTKQGGAVKSWKRRYFVLKDNFLFYYKKPKDDSPTGIIHLEDYVVEEFLDDTEKKNCFKINTKSRVWLLQADRQIEMDIWIECIRNAAPWWCNAAIASSVSIRRDTIPRKKKHGSFRFSTYLPATKDSAQPRK